VSLDVAIFLITISDANTYIVILWPNMGAFHGTGTVLVVYRTST